GASADAHHVTSPHPQGVGAEAAVRAALADAGASPADVGHVNAHGTSTPLNDLAEGRMLSRVLTGDPLVTSTKGVTGHLLGAAGAVEAALTVLTLEEGVVPPTAGLSRLDPRLDIEVARSATPTRAELAVSNSFGFGGQNAVLVIAAA
ncbi:3-oxoacyl-ACP synthase, partial [Streptomyces sp. S6]